MKAIVNKCYALVFKESIELRFGRTVVEHRKPKRNETELETAVKLIRHYKYNGAYNHYLQIERLAEGTNEPLKAMRTEEAWYRFLQSDYCKALNELEKKVYDTSLNKMWESKYEKSNSDNR